MPNAVPLTKRIVLAGALAIGVLVAIVYQPVISSGFHFDDWENIESIGRRGIGQFIVKSFDPMDPSFLTSYRPIQGVMLALEYAMFGRYPVNYHVVHIALHAVNALLLGLVAWLMLENIRMATISGMFYATMAVFSRSVFLPSAPDIIATLFYLLAVACWLVYLRKGRGWAFVLAHLSFILGLLTKEPVVTLPAVLFLLDRPFSRDTWQLPRLLRRYGPAALIVVVYMFYEIVIQPKSTLYLVYGMRLGPHVFTNAIGYLSGLVFPWSQNLPSAALLVWVLALVIAFVILRPPTRFALVICAWTLLPILPVLGLANNFDLRFLYLASAGAAVLFAWLVDAAWQRLSKRNLALVVASLVVLIVVLFSATEVQRNASDYSVSAVEWRAPFRDMSRQHPEMPPGTFVYLVNSPFWVRALSGMFFVKYGEAVRVSGTNEKTTAQFAAYTNPLIYYFDETRKPVEVAVQKDLSTAATPSLPVTLGGKIRLEGYELSADRLKPGQDLVLVLYWRAMETVDKDYQVSVQMFDREDMVTGVDGTPVGGTAPTSRWVTGELVVDGLVLHIPEDAPINDDYRLEVGMYYLPTMERLPIEGNNGAPSTDSVVIAPMQVRSQAK